MNNRKMDGGQERESLRAERDRAVAILDAIGASYLLSNEGTILDVNDALCELVGFEREELIGQTVPWPFWPPEGQGALLARRAEILGRGANSRHGEVFEMPLMHRDGRRFIVELRVTPAHTPDGTLLGWVSTVRDVSERRDYEVELERLATHDPLTGLANRRLFEERLDEEIADAMRHGRAVAIAILDLDNFKAVNDRFGHPVGDQVLKGLARRLESIVRKGELLARVGGEEFALIMPEVSDAGAVVAAERARAAVSSQPFMVEVPPATPDGGGHSQIGLDITISIGIAHVAELQDAEQLYERADQALYRAKRGGRNRSVVWTAAASGPLA